MPAGVRLLRRPRDEPVGRLGGADPVPVFEPDETLSVREPTPVRYRGRSELEVTVVPAGALPRGPEVSSPTTARTVSTASPRLRRRAPRPVVRRRSVRSRASAAYRLRIAPRPSGPPPRPSPAVWSSVPDAAKRAAVVPHPVRPLLTGFAAAPDSLRLTRDPGGLAAAAPNASRRDRSVCLSPARPEVVFVLTRRSEITGRGRTRHRRSGAAVGGRGFRAGRSTRRPWRSARCPRRSGSWRRWRRWRSLRPWFRPGGPPAARGSWCGPRRSR